MKQKRSVRVNYQDDAEAPQVAGFIISSSLEKLRRRVLQREAGSLQGGAAGGAEPGEPKVYDFQRGVLPLVCKQHVLQGNQRKSTMIQPLFVYGSAFNQHEDPLKPTANIPSTFIKHRRMNTRECLISRN